VKPFWHWLSIGILAALLLQGCENARPTGVPSSLDEQINGALARAADFLIERQSSDGAWRSPTYGAFKEGDALTPLVLRALLATPKTDKRTRSIRKGTDFLAAKVRPNGTIDPGQYGLTYPVYTAAAAAVVLRKCGEEQLRAAEAWLAFLRRQQLTEDLGWLPGDRQYGGWGYAKDVPRKPATGQPIPVLTEPNLSATRFAVEALQVFGCTADDQAIVKALGFIKSCQNYAEPNRKEDAALDDGGFFFIHDDPVRNKAGVAAKDREGRQRFASYGSATADGLNSLLACGLSKEHPRLVAARRWLENHFDADHHPGAYAMDRRFAQPALDFYYSASDARALRAVKGNDIRWAELLASALLRRQRPDGSWSNEAVEVREDDSLVATALVVEALGACQGSELLMNCQKGLPLASVKRGSREGA
jgi:squalene-hopene/tetraprenyl-beta-curcumene cyclase